MSPALRTTLKIAGGILGVIVVGILGVVTYISLVWDRTYERPVSMRIASSDAAVVARGEYLYQNTLTCWGCHSPSQTPGDLPSGGFRMDLTNVGPGFGVLYSSNITPDVETGIGSWTDGEIARALRESIDKEGKTLFIMPANFYHGLSDDDTYAMISYLRSLPAVRNPIPPNEPSFVLKALYAFEMIRPEPPIPEPVIAPPRGITVEYGKYMATHGSLCVDCHTPRNLQTGEFHMDSLFAGSSIGFGEIEGEPLVVHGRNISQDSATGIGTWNEEDFLLSMRAGMSKDGTVLGTHMPYAYYGLWPEDDLKAIYVYLKTVKPVSRPNIPAVKRDALADGIGTERGKAIFQTRCVGCHGKEGSGLPPTKVKLAEVAPSLDDKVVADFIANGNLGLRMPAFGKTLTEEEIRDVVAYIRTWDQPAK